MSGQKSWPSRGAGNRPGTLRATQNRGTHVLALASIAKASAPAGSDPYNTSGSFDRARNWERVGKR